MSIRYWLQTVTVSAVAAFASAASAQSVTVVSSGGATQAAQKEAIYTPFTEATGIAVVEDSFDYNFGTIRAQVESGSIKWDVLNLTGSLMKQACDEGMLEEIDWSTIPEADKYPKELQHKCGAGGGLIGSSVLTYDAKRLKEAPTSWADFWDLKKFPGKRGMLYAPVETMEIALIADGVPYDEVYKQLSTPEGVDRAFKKLDEIKSSIVWWKTGAESTQRLVSGEVVMTTAWHARPFAANKENPDLDLRVVWSAGYLRGWTTWSILKGAPHKEEAFKFVRYAAGAEPQARFATAMRFGAPNSAANALLSDEIKASLPSSEENAKYALAWDYDFWSQHQEELTERFNNWAPQ